MAIDLFSLCLGAIWGAITVVIAAVLLAYAGASTLTRIEEEEFKK